VAKNDRYLLRGSKILLTQHIEVLDWGYRARFNLQPSYSIFSFTYHLQDAQQQGWVLTGPISYSRRGLFCSPTNRMTSRGKERIPVQEPNVSGALGTSPSCHDTCANLPATFRNPYPRFPMGTQAPKVASGWQPDAPCPPKGDSIPHGDAVRLWWEAPGCLRFQLHATHTVGLRAGPLQRSLLHLRLFIHPKWKA